MKILSLLLALVFTTTALAAASPEKIQKDSLQLGLATSGLSKQFIFDTNDGASNKKISIDSATKKISINTDVETTGTLTGDGVVNAQGELKLGSGTNASKQMTVDRAGFDPYVKWNEASQKWVFSQDGTNEKNFGSGSGGEGGVNLLQNPSFEDGISVDWTSSGGTFSLQTYATPDPSGNDSFYARLVASGAGQYFESVAHAIPSNLTGGCLAKIKYNTTDAANWKLQVYDGSANLLKEETLLVKNWQDGFASFPCPTVGTTVKMRVISIAAGQIEGDKGHLGSETRTFQVAQAKQAGESYFSGTGSCSWLRTSATIGALGTSATCPGPTINSSTMGDWLTTDTDLPRQTINNLPSGTYKATFYIVMGTSAAGGTSFAINDGSTTCKAVKGSETVTPAYAPVTVSCVFNYSSQGNRVFELYGASSSAATITIPNGITADSIKFQLDYYPNGSQTALTPEAQDWMIDANIGGANSSLGSSDVASYTGIEAATLDLVVNSGSSPAKIPCSSTNAATGLTCSSGNESVGINFVNPEVGFYEACFDFSHITQMNGVGSKVEAAFQVVETTNSTQTIIQEGKTRTMSYSQNDLSAANTLGNGSAIRNCGTFYFGSVGERTLRLVYEQDVTATVSGNNIVADRAATVGQRDIHVVVKNVSQAYNRPYLLPNEAFRAITSNYTAVSTDQTISHSGSAATLTLPSAVLMPGKIFKIRSSGGNLLTVNFSGGETIDNSLTSFVVSGNITFSDGVEVQSTGTGWTFLNATGIRTVICGVTNGGTAAMTAGTGCDSWVSSVATGATGRVDMTLKTGVFTGTYACTENWNNTGAPRYIGHDIASTTLIRVYTADSTNPTNVPYSITCVGRR